MKSKLNIMHLYLELHGPHAPADDEGVPLVDRSVRLQEVGLEVDLEPITGQALTNERRVLGVLTNKRRVLPPRCRRWEGRGPSCRT